jgi:hypothetical protein
MDTSTITTVKKAVEAELVRCEDELNKLDSTNLLDLGEIKFFMPPNKTCNFWREIQNGLFLLDLIKTQENCKEYEERLKASLVDLENLSE